MTKAGSVVVSVAPLALRGSLSPDTMDEEKRTVDVVWTTGARVLRGFYDQFWEELSLDPKHVRLERLNSGAPLLNSHNGFDLGGVIGVVESARLEKGRGVARVRFARAEDDPAADAIFRKIKDGIIRNVSVGYRINKMEKVQDEAGKVPVFRAVDWTPHEISIVPIGADAGAGVRGEQATNPCEFIEERNMSNTDPENTTAPAPAPAPAPQPVAADQRAAAETERERVLGIQRVARALARPAAEVDTAIAAGTSLESYRATAVDAVAVAPAADGGPIHVTRSVTSGEDARDKWMRGATAAILARAAATPVVVAHARANGQSADFDPGEFRGMKLLDLARAALERSGQRTAGMTAMEVAGAALSQRSQGGFASTGDFPVLLENALNKVLLARYGTTADTWRRFCRVGSVTDFRASPRYRQGSFGKLDAVNQAGEFANKAIPDGEKQSLTAATKGNIIAITRQAIVNDDMGAFSSLAMDLGRAAALTIELDVYALLALNAGLGPAMSDGNTLFHATHNNLTTGAALGSNAIDLDRVALASQKDVSSNEILSLTPSILLVPISLEGQAKQINNGQYDFDAISTKNPWTPNKVAGVFRDIVGTARLTGTRRYVFADPADAATIEVAFLEGQQAPVMEMNPGFRVDGVEWKVRLDYGVAAVDFRGAVTNAGV